MNCDDAWLPPTRYKDVEWVPSVTLKVPTSEFPLYPKAKDAAPGTISLMSIWIPQSNPLTVVSCHCAEDPPNTSPVPEVRPMVPPGPPTLIALLLPARPKLMFNTVLMVSPTPLT